MGANLRNKPCSCGSGLKYKRCCLRKDEAPKPRAPLTAEQRAAAVRARLLLASFAGAVAGYEI